MYKSVSFRVIIYVWCTAADFVISIWSIFTFQCSYFSSLCVHFWLKNIYLFSCLFCLFTLKAVKTSNGNVLVLFDTVFTSFPIKLEGYLTHWKTAEVSWKDTSCISVLFPNTHGAGWEHAYSLNMEDILLSLVWFCSGITEFILSCHSHIELPMIINDDLDTCFLGALPIPHIACQFIALKISHCSCWNSN